MVNVTNIAMDRIMNNVRSNMSSKHRDELIANVLYEYNVPFDS